MSNSSILIRLEDEFEKHLLQKVDTYDFGDYLVKSIQALEAVEYETIQVARDFQYKFEIAVFSDEEPTIASVEKLTADFRRWLRNLQNK